MDVPMFCNQLAEDERAYLINGHNWPPTGCIQWPFLYGPWAEKAAGCSMNQSGMKFAA
jgi:hypothetical protein